MRHTDAEIEDAASHFERLADNLDPATAIVEDLSDLRAVAEAAEHVRQDEALVTKRAPQIETFGENVGTLTDEFFSFDVTATGFHKMLAAILPDGRRHLRSGVRRAGASSWRVSLRRGT
jgi:hypothetical protein